ncbi:MAG: GNAT family N-acetyltransferase [Ancrocorticia sp.]
MVTIKLKRTSTDDFMALRHLFDDPSFHGWSGSGRVSDDVIRTKYLGLRYPDVECFLVLADDDVAGFTQLHVADEGEGGGMDLILLPQVRGQGVGQQVVAEMVRRAQEEHEWSRFTVDPDITNTDGIRFWQRCGFIPEEVITVPETSTTGVIMAWPTIEVNGHRYLATGVNAPKTNRNRR